MKIFFVKNKEKYETLKPKYTNFTSGDFLQSYEWGEFQKKINNKIFRIIIKDSRKNQVCRATLIEKKVLALKYFLIPYGPFGDYDKLGTKKTRKIFHLIKKISRLNRYCFIRFNPPIPASSLNYKKFFENEFYLSKARTKEPQKTLYLDLTQTADDLLSKMKSKTRYNIKLAQRKELKLKKGYDNKMIKDFLLLLEETSKRNEFSLHQKTYYQKMIKTLGTQKMLKIFTAYHKDKPVASNIIIFYNKCATYLHGASSGKHRNLMGTYLLQWEAMKEAKKLNCLFYDFWGIDEEKWPGVTKFKLGFGGKIMEYLPTYEMPVLNLRFKLFNLAKRLLQ